jgi:hypothetical protein
MTTNENKNARKEKKTNVRYDFILQACALKFYLHREHVEGRIYIGEMNDKYRQTIEREKKERLYACVLIGVSFLFSVFLRQMKNPEKN